MANTKIYNLIGVGPDLQLGKSGGRMRWVVDHYEMTAADGTTLSQVRVPTTPLHNNDSVSKGYVDSVANGLDAKASARVATLANIATLSGLLTVDGIVLSVGDRVVVKNQTTASTNGIYAVASGAWSRTTDAASTGDITGGTFVFIEEGTLNADTGWVVSTNGTPVIGTDPIAFVQFSSAGVIQAGIGATKSGNIIDVNVGAATISVNGSDNLILNSSAIANQVMLSTGTIGTEASFGALPLGNTAAVTGLLGQSNGGLNANISAYASGSLLIQGTGVVTELPVGTNGNALIMTAGVPSWGTINLTDNINVVTGILKEANGGTNQSTYLTGDLLYASAVNTLGKLALGTNGQVLQSNGTNVVWGAPVSTATAKMVIESDITFSGGATQLIGTIPLGSRVTKISLAVTTAWTSPETIDIGDAGIIGRLMSNTANDPQQPFIFTTDEEYVYLGATSINATVTNAGTPTAGTAHVIVEYIHA